MDILICGGEEGGDAIGDDEGDYFSLSLLKISKEIIVTKIELLQHIIYTPLRGYSDSLLGELSGRTIAFL
jgi:hypothetical protein